MQHINKLSVTDKYTLAKNENTSADILTLLSKEKKRNLLKRIASNPNASLETLEELSHRFPDRVAKNPASQIIYLKNPHRAKFLEIAWARSEHTPTSKLLELVQTFDVEVIVGILERKNIPPSVFEKVISYLDKEVELENQSKVKLLKNAWAKSEHTPTSKLLELVAFFDDEVIKNIFKRKIIPSSVLRKIISYSDRNINKEIASLKKTPVEILDILAKDSDPFIRLCVAKNKKYPKDSSINILKELMAHPNVYLHRLIVKHTSKMNYKI